MPAKVAHPVKTIPEYAVWRSMKQRCSNPKNPSYLHYGGRGITVCERWRASFRDFLNDMGSRPSVTHSIDRRENDGHYEPGNCYWATAHEQRVNSRSAPIMDLRGYIFGRLTALYALPRQPFRATQWTCRCSCGVEIRVGIGHLRNSHTRSCGCLQREVTTQRNLLDNPSHRRSHQRLGQRTLRSS